MSLINTIQFITDHPLNRDQRISSIIRFIKWQVGSRLVPGAIVYDWINGSKFLVKTGETGLTGNIYTGLHEFPDMGFLLHFLRGEDLFVDIGANVGSYTVSAKDSAPLQPGWHNAYSMFQGNKASIFSSVSAAAMCCNT